MPEPADHREQAEEWLAVAVRDWEDRDKDTATASALIGIGHALLALSEPKPQRTFSEAFDDAQAAGHDH
jgi:hypothetical protein